MSEKSPEADIRAPLPIGEFANVIANAAPRMARYLTSQAKILGAEKANWRK